MGFRVCSLFALAETIIIVIVILITTITELLLL